MGAIEGLVYPPHFFVFGVSKNQPIVQSKMPLAFGRFSAPMSDEGHVPDKTTIIVRMMRLLLRIIKTKDNFSQDSPLVGYGCLRETNRGQHHA